jgi:hypothetical protein
MLNNDVDPVNKFQKKNPIFYKFIIIYLIWWYIDEFLKDSIVIFKNLKNDINTKKLNVLSILYNSFIKYPLMGFLPSSYFKYELYQNSYKNYISFCKIYPILAKKNSQDLYLFDNKLMFKLYLDQKIKQTKLIAFFNPKDKKIIHYEKPRTDKVVIKPIKGATGKGFKIISSKRFIDNLKKYKKSSLVEDYIEQHKFLNKIFSKSVNTLRVLTFKDKEKIQIISMILKVGTSSTNHVDNIGRGGIPIAIDLDLGILLKAHFYKDHNHFQYIRHPETNYEFQGKILPFFQEVKDMAIKAHEMFPKCAIVGWDIAITENGPLLVEGNGLPDIPVMQICDPFKEKLNPFF